ncbi:magnesium transporter MgtE [Marinobacterium nitratireducens]|uniref:Magnesium transporter MgtE n=1 Tax=Marinobacterium nitratireducens TaxID=518897 RepID=A0A917ZKG1_9GAMM|nr:magnesium transporter [Marinobacterium nitratireducens]GGO83619.1 magnesium transporter MgtE [Marinobacterium nitratireducens]
MSTEQPRAAALLQQVCLNRYPAEATHLLEKLPATRIADLLGEQPPELALAVWERLVPDIAGEVLESLDDGRVRELLSRANPNRCVAWLASVSPGRRDSWMALLDETRAGELNTLMAFPPGSAGALMDPRILVFRADMTVREGLQRLRASQRHDILSLFVLDGDNRLSGVIPIQVLAVASPAARLHELMQPVTAWVEGMTPRDEVVDKLEELRIIDLPVVDLDGRLIGVVPPQALMEAAENEATATLQTMVGTSKEERALSRVSFAVGKRLPWLQINLLTAFIAASVVGLFESTIAQFTALAVLLPVVAGQSGNTGAQALAVTMRGLALREVRSSHWGQLLFKEALVGFLNGLAVSGVTALGVWIWSGSTGLALVICLAMILSMVVAGMAGATIPVVLTSLGQDPAQSSSIFLTTITDIVGFFSFLGIATLLSAML